MTCKRKRPLLKVMKFASNFTIYNVINVYLFFIFKDLLIQLAVIYVTNCHWISLFGDIHVIEISFHNVTHY